MQGLWGFRCAQGGIVSARAKPSTRCRCGQRGSVLLNVVLPTVALRSLQVLGMWVKNGGRLLADDELQDKQTALPSVS